MAKLVMALVLVDIASHALKAGQLLEGSPELIGALAKAGDVDPHKDAVAYAKSQGAEPVRSIVERQAAERAAQADACRVRIAEIEALYAAATDDATKAALQAELDAKRAELASLT